MYNTIPSLLLLLLLLPLLLLLVGLLLLLLQADLLLPGRVRGADGGAQLL